MQEKHKKISRIAHTLLACTLLATACSGPLVLGSIYNSAPKRITKELKSYATFNKSQKKTIDSRFAQYHQWHRSTQLPLYSDLLLDIAAQVDSQTDITLEQVSLWTNQITQFSIAVRHCNPLNDATDLMATLTKEQTDQIKHKTAEEHALRVQKYNSETVSERAERRHREILGSAKRVGLKFNSLQSDLLRKTLLQQVSLGGQRLYLWQQWTDRFNELLDNRDNKNFTDNMNQHIHALWTLTQSNYPQEWQSSTQLWTNFLHRFLAMQTARQNQALYKKTTSVANTLETISKDGKDSVSGRCFATLR